MHRVMGGRILKRFFKQNTYKNHNAINKTRLRGARVVDIGNLYMYYRLGLLIASFFNAHSFPGSLKLIILNNFQAHSNTDPIC